MRELEGNESADGFGENDAESDADGEFEVAVERKKNQENQQNSERADDDELRFGFEQLAVLAAPIERVTVGEFDGFGNRGLSVVDDAFEISPFNRKLNADITRIVFAVDEGSAGTFLDGGELGKGNLLAGGSGHEQIADVTGAGAKLRLHADDEVEKFFALDDLRGGLAANSSLNDSFHVGDVDAISRDFPAVSV